MMGSFHFMSFPTGTWLMDYFLFRCHSFSWSIFHGQDLRLFPPVISNFVEFRGFSTTWDTVSASHSSDNLSYPVRYIVMSNSTLTMLCQMRQGLAILNNKDFNQLLEPITPTAVPKSANDQASQTLVLISPCEQKHRFVDQQGMTIMTNHELPRTLVAQPHPITNHSFVSPLVPGKNRIILGPWLLW